MKKLIHRNIPQTPLVSDDETQRNLYFFLCCQVKTPYISSVTKNIHLFYKVEMKKNPWFIVI